MANALSHDRHPALAPSSSVRLGRPHNENSNDSTGSSLVLTRNPSLVSRFIAASPRRRYRWNSRALVLRLALLQPLTFGAVHDGRAQASAPAVLPEVRISGRPFTPTLADPATVSSTRIDRDTVRQLRIDSLEAINAYTPSFRLSTSLGPGTQGYVLIRGIGATQAAFDPAAGVVVDDVPFSDPHGYLQPLFAIESIEVLRGSQATRFGGISYAGLVDIRSQLPGTTREAAASLDLFTPRSARSVLSASAPLSDPRVRLGVALLTERGESAHRNVVDGVRGSREVDAGRFQLRLLPIDQLDVLVTLATHRLREGQGTVLIPADQSAYNRLIAPTGFRVSRHDLAHDNRGQRDVDSNQQSVRLKWFGEQVEWTVVAARRRFQSDYTFDLDETPIAAPLTPPAGVPLTLRGRYDTGNDYYELRGQSAQAAALVSGFTWRSGVSYSTQKARTRGDLGFPVGFPGLFGAGGTARVNDFDASGHNAAWFGEATQRLLDAKLGLTAGLRHETTQRRALFITGDPVFGLPGSLEQVDDRQWLPKVGVDWRFDPRTTAYGHLATGWRPAAINLYRTPGDSAIYRSERSTTLEAGARMQFAPAAGFSRSAEHRSELRASVYSSRVRDYQEVRFTSPGSGIILNAPEVNIEGAEIEAKWAASARMTLTSGAGYTDARYGDFLAVPATGLRLDGRALPNVPRWNAFASARWRDGPLRLGAEVIGADGFNAAYADPAAPVTRVKGYTAINLSAGVEQRHWSVTVYTANLANTRYLLNSQFSIAGGQLPVGAPGQPRTFGVQGRWTL